MIAIEIAPEPVGTYQDNEDGGRRHRSFPTRAFDLYVRRREPWVRPEDHIHMFERLRKSQVGAPSSPGCPGL
jgi:hypothetical protein